VQRRAREILERQVSHMTRLVDDLLDITRISRGKVDLQQRPVPLRDVVAAALETSRPLIEAGGHRLAVEPGEPLTVFADPVRLAQVISNLLNNAAKYTPRGGRIELAVRRENGSAVVSVRDNGVGIAAEELPNLFDMFVQSETTRRRAPGGLGVGLALARELALAHGGALEARSDGPGRGAEFSVRIPV
jgi:signal transduction histidine kinase